MPVISQHRRQEGGREVRKWIGGPLLTVATVVSPRSPKVVHSVRGGFIHHHHRPCHFYASSIVLNHDHNHNSSHYSNETRRANWLPVQTQKAPTKKIKKILKTLYKHSNIIVVVTVHIFSPRLYTCSSTADHRRPRLPSPSVAVSKTSNFAPAYRSFTLGTPTVLVLGVVVVPLVTRGNLSCIIPCRVGPAAKMKPSALHTSKTQRGEQKRNVNTPCTNRIPKGRPTWNGWCMPHDRHTPRVTTARSTNAPGLTPHRALDVQLPKSQNKDGTTKALLSSTTPQRQRHVTARRRSIEHKHVCIYIIYGIYTYTIH